jgi:short subunit dehydrogenase-like uncharacterized protein
MCLESKRPARHHTVRLEGPDFVDKGQGNTQPIFGIASVESTRSFRAVPRSARIQNWYQTFLTASLILGDSPPALDARPGILCFHLSEIV